MFDGELELRLHVVGDKRELRVAGRLDVATAEMLRSALTRLAGTLGSADRAELNLSQVTSVDQAGAEAVRQGAELFESLGVRLHIVGVAHRVEQAALAAQAGWPATRRDPHAVLAQVEGERYVVDQAAVAGAILRRCVDAPEYSPAQDMEARLQRAREAFDVDLAMITELVDGREVARRVVGEWPGVAVDDLQGASLPLEDTFCQRLLDGRIPSVIPDVRGDERVRDLVLARALGVGAWMGVALRTPDARLYVLCCLAREARPTLGRRDVAKLRRFAVAIGVDLEVAGAPATTP